MTGLYPWSNGASGFNPVFDGVTTLIELIKEKYSTGIIGKAEHLSPQKKFNWDFKVNGYTNFCSHGKEAKKFYELSKCFFKNAKKPFFLMVNSHHPHRSFPNESRFLPNDIKVPGFLPDVYEVRNDLSLYYEGVKRCDDAVGVVLEALIETNNLENTLILFTSDHGMAFPFVKANCYHFSTKVPLIWYCPKLIEPKIIDTFVSGVDIMPTLLEFIEQDKKPPMQGSSYKETLINGKKFKNEVFTCLCKLYSGKNFETRAIHNKEYCYIVNHWANGSNKFVEDGSIGGTPCMNAIRKHKPEDLKKLDLDNLRNFMIYEVILLLKII